MSVVATAIDRYSGVPINEMELIDITFYNKPGNCIYMVILADLAKSFEWGGIAVRAFKLDWNGLIELLNKGYSPLVLHYTKPEKHFSLLLGFKGAFAITIYPARGLELFSRTTLVERYSGAAMTIALNTMRPNRELIKEAIKSASKKITRLEATTISESLREGNRW